MTTTKESQTQSTEYIIAMKDGDTRFFESLKEARDFIEENRNNVNGRIEKRVWNHEECGAEHHWCEIDEQKTKMVTVEDFMKARSDPR